jgi:phosphoglycerate dehydrogenase-like enzyme
VALVACSVSGFWDDAMLDHAPRLRYIQSIGVGINQFPLERLRERGIVLCNAVGVNSPAVAEHALALMLAISRRLGEARDNQHKGDWRPYISDPAAREFELRGKTVAVVGLGAIGEGVARYASRLPRILRPPPAACPFVLCVRAVIASYSQALPGIRLPRGRNES